MTIDADALASLALEYTKAMTSIRGRRVQRLLKREFAGAEYVLRVEAPRGAAAVLGLSAHGAALCVTDGRGKEAPVIKWLHAATTAIETRYDLHKDSLPVLSTTSLPLARVREQRTLHVAPGTIPGGARSLMSRALEDLA